MESRWRHHKRGNKPGRHCMRGDRFECPRRQACTRSRATRHTGDPGFGSADRDPSAGPANHWRSDSEQVASAPSMCPSIIWRKQSQPLHLPTSGSATLATGGCWGESELRLSGRCNGFSHFSHRLEWLKGHPLLHLPHRAVSRHRRSCASIAPLHPHPPLL